MWQQSPVYNQNIDVEIIYGKSSGLLRRSLAGGSWGYDTNTGSRSFDSHCFPIHQSSNFTTRGCKYNCIILGRHGMIQIMILVVIRILNIDRYIMLP